MYLKGTLSLLLLLMIALIEGRVTPPTSNDASEYKTSGDYCDPGLCMWGPHIGCGNNGTFSSRCVDAQMVDMTPQLIDLILDLHNSGRNRAALGQLEGYNSATAMPVIKWDDELQFLAELNVRKCKYGHDQCFHTHRFRCGQNIGMAPEISKKISIDMVRDKTKVLIDMWFNEFPDADQGFINSLRSHPQGKKIEHFTQMVSDRVKRVGCAAATYTANKLFNFSFTCNYDFWNFGGHRVYESGDPATNCPVGRNERYQGLCDW